MSVSTQSFWQKEFAIANEEFTKEEDYLFGNDFLADMHAKTATTRYNGAPTITVEHEVLNMNDIKKFQQYRIKFFFERACLKAAHPTGAFNAARNNALAFCARLTKNLEGRFERVVFALRASWLLYKEAMALEPLTDKSVYQVAKQVDAIREKVIDKLSRHGSDCRLIGWKETGCSITQFLASSESGPWKSALLKVYHEKEIDYFKEKLEMKPIAPWTEGGYLTAPATGRRLLQKKVRKLWSSSSIEENASPRTLELLNFNDGSYKRLTLPSAYGGMRAYMKTAGLLSAQTMVYIDVRSSAGWVKGWYMHNKEKADFGAAQVSMTYQAFLGTFFSLEQNKDHYQRLFQDRLDLFSFRERVKSDAKFYNTLVKEGEVIYANKLGRLYLESRKLIMAQVMEISLQLRINKNLFGKTLKLAETKQRCEKVHGVGQCEQVNNMMYAKKCPPNTVRKIDTKRFTCQLVCKDSTGSTNPLFINQVTNCKWASFKIVTDAQKSSLEKTYPGHFSHVSDPRTNSILPNKHWQLVQGPAQTNLYRCPAGFTQRNDPASPGVTCFPNVPVPYEFFNFFTWKLGDK